MNFLKQITLFSLFLPLFTPLLGMEKSAIAWFQPKNTEGPIGFEAESLPYSKTLEWLSNEAPTTAQNPSFVREVSQNTLATCKMLFEHLHTLKDQLVDNEQKARYLAEYFSTEIKELNEEEVQFLDIPVFAQVLKKNSTLFFTKKRKREDSPTDDSQQKDSTQKYITLLTLDDQEIKITEAPLKKAKVFYDLITDTTHGEGEDDAVIPTNLNTPSAQILAAFLNFINDQEETITKNFEGIVLKKISHLTQKKENKLRAFLPPETTTFVINLYEILSQKRIKFYAKQQSIQSLSQEEKKLEQQTIEEKFAQKIATTEDYFNTQKKNILASCAKKFIKEYCTTFQDAITIAEIGDFAGCTLLFENALDAAHDFLAGSKATFNFDELNHSIAARLNEKIQGSIARIKFFERKVPTWEINHDTFSPHLIRFADADIVQWAQHTVVRSNISTSLPNINSFFQISPDGETLARKNDTRQCIEVFDLKTKKVHQITWSTLFPTDINGFIPAYPHILSFTYLPDSSNLEIRVDYKEAIHFCHYSFVDSQLKIIKKIDLPTHDAHLLWHFSDSENLFIQNKELTYPATLLFFNTTQISLPHNSRTLLYCFTRDHTKIITYNDIENILDIRDAKTGLIIQSLATKNPVSKLSSGYRGNKLAVLSHANSKNAEISLFDTNTGRCISSFDISDMLSYSSATKTQLNRIFNFYITPCNKHIVVEQSTGLMARGLITTIIDIKTQAKILESSGYTSMTCFPDGSIMQIKVNDSVAAVSYELFDAPGLKMALHSCSLEESLLIENIINSSAYVLNDSEKEMYKTLPQALKNIIKSHLA